MEATALNKTVSQGGSRFFKNSIWGLVSTVLQTLFLSVLFVITSKYYSIAQFSNFLISSSIYQLIVGFSSMGLGHWFIREYEHDTTDRSALITRFIKIQTYLGTLFYFLNIALVFVLYRDPEIIWLAVILGTNIIFDNIIYAIKSLNIAEWQQRKTSIIMAIDGLLRLGIGCILFFEPISIYYFCLYSVLIRLVTVNIFLKFGSSNHINLKSIWKFRISFKDFQNQVFVNWRFIIIAGLAIIFWRSSIIIISKFLTPADVANYEVSFKIFSVFNMIPIVAATTIYPKLVNLAARGGAKSIEKMYHLIFWVYVVLSFICYAFIQSYAELIILLIFGKKLILAAGCLKNMMLTFLIFPTVLLQANVLMALKLEKIDMYCNIFALLLNLTISMVGLYYYSSLEVINYSIFISFIAFHLIQSVILFRLKIGNFYTMFAFYILLACFIALYGELGKFFNGTIVFGSFLTLTMVILFLCRNKIMGELGLLRTMDHSSPSPVNI